MADWQTLSDRINQRGVRATTLDRRFQGEGNEGRRNRRHRVRRGRTELPNPRTNRRGRGRGRAGPENYRYTPTAGLPELRQAIADKTLRDSGYEIDPSQVIVTNGGKQAVYESFQILLNEGDEVITPHPVLDQLSGSREARRRRARDRVRRCRPQLRAQHRSHRSGPHRTHEGHHREHAEQPDGRGVEAGNRQGHRAVGRSNTTSWVSFREIYEHLNYDGAKTTYIGAAVPEVRSQLLVLNGVAKTYAMPGWRVGWMIAPVDVAKAASKLQGHMTSNVNNISQRAAIEAVSGSLDAVYEMRAAFDKRRQTIVAALNDIEGVNCPTPTGAFYAFADVTALLNKPIGTNKTTFANTSELAAALLDEGHVAAVPGEAFGAPGYLRFSYALADDDLVEGMRRMKRWVED